MSKSVETSLQHDWKGRAKLCRRLPYRNPTLFAKCSISPLWHYGSITTNAADLRGLDMLLDNPLSSANISRVR